MSGVARANRVGRASRAGRVAAYLRWWVRQVSGDDRYAAHVARCVRAGQPAMSRAAWERHRSDHRDAHPEGRCC